MLTRLLNLFTESPTTTSQTAEDQPPRKPIPAGVPVYPPIDQGIAIASAPHVVNTQANLIKRIKLLAGASEDDFNLRYLSVIHRLAEYIQLLPASETESHTGPGGLFRLCLEIGFFSAQAAEGIVFTGRGTAEDRRREEPRWRYAAFIAGITCELHRCVTCMTVVDKRGRVWPAFNQSLQSWLAESDGDRYFVRWVCNERNGAATAGLLVNKVVSPNNLQYLHDGSPRIVPIMMNTITGMRTTEKSALSIVVDQMREQVLHRDKSIQPTYYGKLTVGSHLEPHLLDAMRQMVANGKWRVNERKARLWYSSDGLFLVWRLAAKEIVDHLSASSLSGFPQDAQTLLEILLAANVLVNDKDGSPYWMIIPPGEKTELAAVKFANPMTIFGAILDEVKLVGTLDGKEPVKTQQNEDSAKNITQTPKDMPPVSEVSKPENTPQTLLSKTESTPEIKDERPGEIGGAIPELDKTKEGVKMPATAAALLRPATREVMNAILTEHMERQNKANVGPVENGFAISIEYMAGFGVALDDILKNLQEAGWLYAPPEKPAKKLHQVELANKKTNAIIIKTAQARHAGFIQ